MAAAIALAVFLLVCGLIGLKMGVLKMVYAIICLVISITISIILCPTVSTFLAEHINLEEYMESNVESTLSEKFKEVGEQGTLELEKEALKQMKIPASWQRRILKNADEDGFRENGVDDFTELTSKIISQNCMKTLIFFILFLLLAILFRVVTVVFKLADLIAKLPVFKEGDKISGMLLGLLLGAVVIGVVMAFLPSFTQFTWGQRLAESINANFFTGFCYRHNLFLWIISML